MICPPDGLERAAVSSKVHSQRVPVRRRISTPVSQGTCGAAWTSSERTRSGIRLQLSAEKEAN